MIVVAVAAVTSENRGTIMSDNVAGMIIFVVLAGGIIGLIVLGRFLLSLFDKGSTKHESEFVSSEEDESSNVAKERYDKMTEEVSLATGGSGRYAGSPYFLE